jgi:hypothetical protein
MTVRRDGEVIYLEGVCEVGEAETVVAALEQGARAVDLSSARQLHGAVVQVLLQFKPELRGAPEQPFVRDVLIPAMNAAGAIDQIQP